VETLTIPPRQRPVEATVVLPGSKSDTNRALLLAALAEGTSVIEGALFAEDTGYMARALQALGFAVVDDPASQRFTVTGAGGAIPATTADLFIGNAGTAARFLTAACALGHGRYRLDGVPRMRQRPIQPLLDGLAQLGGRARSILGTGCPPVLIEGQGLTGGTARLPGDTSSQFISALLMVAPYARDGVTIEVVGPLVSAPYLDLTTAVMAAFGVQVETAPGPRFVVAPGQRYRARHYRVEPDATAASYFFAAAAVTGGRVRIPGLTRQSRQGDIRFVEVLAAMGCAVTWGPDFIEVQGPDALRGVTVDMRDISDTALTLAAIAPLATTPTEIRGLAHTRHQETDRVHALATELQRLGVPVEELPDGLRIRPAAVQPGVVETYHDHRIAMSFAVLGLRVPGIGLRNPQCVRKTFPDFFDRLAAL